MESDTKASSGFADIVEKCFIKLIKMNSTYVTPVINSILNVMRTMAQLEVEPGKYMIRTNQKAMGDISSIIDLEGPGGKGSVSVSFPEHVIKQIADVMMPPGTPRDIAMLKDLTGELANMFAGGAKAELEKKQLKMNISLPRIYAGDNHILKFAVNAKIVMVPYSTPFGPFFIDVCVAGKNAKLSPVKKKKPIIISSNDNIRNI